MSKRKPSTPKSSAFREISTNFTRFAFVNSREFMFSEAICRSVDKRSVRHDVEHQAWDVTEHGIHTQFFLA